MASKACRGVTASAVLVLGCLLAAAATGAEVYRVIDAAGNVVYTDNPEAGKPQEAVELPPINLQPAVTPSAPVQTPEQSAPHYDIRVVEPVHDSTIPPGQLEVPVLIELKPGLLPGHRLEVAVDGQVQDRPTASTAFRLTELIRGSHQIVASVLDADNRVIGRSAAVVIHVKRHSVKHPSAKPAPIPRR